MVYNAKKLRGKYNLWELAKDEGLTLTEIRNLIKIYSQDLMDYRSGFVSQKVYDKIEEFVLSATDNPEKYDFAICPYVPSGKGRRLGTTNKGSKVKHIPVISKSFNELKQAVGTSTYEKEEQIEKPLYKCQQQIKTPLYDYQDILDILDSGQKVYQDNSSYSFEKYKNTIIRFSGDKPVFISPSLDLTQKYFYYKIPPLTLELNKTYVLKNKKKVLINYIDKEEGIYYAILLGEQLYAKYSEDGRMLHLNSIFNCYTTVQDPEEYKILGEAI